MANPSSQKNRVPAGRSDQFRRKQSRGASPREQQSSQDTSTQAERVSSDLASLLAEPETRLIMQADNVGLEELVAALTKIPIRRRMHR
jgi:hypothetical protein